MFCSLLQKAVSASKCQYSAKCLLVLLFSARKLGVKLKTRSKKKIRLQDNKNHTLIKSIKEKLHITPKVLSKEVLTGILKNSATLKPTKSRRERSFVS